MSGAMSKAAQNSSIPKGAVVFAGMMIVLAIAAAFSADRLIPMFTSDEGDGPEVVIREVEAEGHEQAPTQNAPTSNSAWAAPSGGEGWGATQTDTEEDSGWGASASNGNGGFDAGQQPNFSAYEPRSGRAGGSSQEQARPQRRNESRPGAGPSSGAAPGAPEIAPPGGRVELQNGG